MFSIYQFLKDNAEIIAIVLAPIITWYITILYQNRHEKRKAKRTLFFTLMANRLKNPPTQHYVDALNMIDVVFQKNQKVRTAWKEYYNSLHGDSPQFASNASFLLDLLSEMAKDLGYNDLKQTEIGRTYTPQYFGNVYANQEVLQQELVRVLKASENFGVTIRPPQDEPKNQDQQGAK